MTKKVVCPSCAKVKVIERSLAKYFYCCGNRWLIDNHLKFETEFKPLEEHVKNEPLPNKVKTSLINKHKVKIRLI